MLPSPSKADIARRNGALSKGPVTAAGKARASANATRHGLCARTLILGDGEDKAEFTALRTAMLRHHRPADEAQAHWVEELVFVAWRQRRLHVVEAAVLMRMAAGEDGAGLPSLATLIRYRGRLDRDWRRAIDELAALRRGQAGTDDPAAPVPDRPHTKPQAQERRGTNEPTVPALPAAECTNENLPPAPTLNRQARRRLAALARQELRRAA